ncbi:baculoviral IAP repeat-containing protein 7-B-like [Panulirus ornatus]|uniref:baculoviral IAP repeat-containing protein 7-B-like n=1 Tax=Panulirus ornatus TaxID=150431 RepID=UPI003A891CA5
MASWFKNFDSLKYESERRDTLIDWTESSPVKPDELAKNDFYYLRKYDHCECIFYMGIVGRWEEGDDVRIEHRYHFGECPFVAGIPVGNVPMEVCDALEPLQRHRWQRSVSSGETESQEQPLNNGFVLQADRERSFAGWPENLTQTPKIMAEARFFYYKLGNHVMCFHCGHDFRN